MPPSAGPDDNATLSQRLKELAAQQGGKPALLAPGGAALTFAGLAEEIEDCARRLRVMGLGRGDRVALVAPRGLDAARTILAVASAAVCVPLNPEASATECATILRATRARALYVPRGEAPAARKAAASLGIVIIDEVGRTVSMAAATDKHAASSAEAAAPDDPALVMATSGTTDQPKIVPITHRQLMARGRKTRQLLELGSADRCLNLMPLCYLHGLNSGLFGPLLAGGAAICPESFDQQSFRDGVNEHGATWYTAGATHQQAILGWLRREPAMIAGHRLRFARSGSAPLPARAHGELESLLGVPVVESYSSTETGTMAANPPAGLRKPGTVGICASDDEVAIMDDKGNLAQAGVTGEVVVRGPCVVTSYENDPAANHRAFRDGWFHTGDLGRFDSHGYLMLSGRLKDIINRGGEKISPAEIDAALLTHPAVAEAVAFPVPHPSLHEEVAAAVVLARGALTTEKALREFLATLLAPFKVPRRILLVPEIPKGPTGKPVRAGLAQQFANVLAAAPAPQQASMTALAGELLGIWRECLENQALGPDDDFFEKGGDSLSAVGLLTLISQRLQIDLALYDLARHPTPRQLADAIESPKPDELQGLIAIHPHGQKPPLFAVAGRFGHSLKLLKLAKKLDPGQPFYALQPPAMDWEQAGCRELQDMAAHYVGMVRRVQEHGPYRLFGESFGGLMVYEMALQLRAAGEAVELLVMADTLPANLSLGDQIIEDSPMAMKQARPGMIEAEAATVRVGHAHVHARKAYLLDKPFDGEIIYFLCAADAISPMHDRRRLWRHFAKGGVKWLVLPCGHGGFYEGPQFAMACNYLNACLAGETLPALDSVPLFAPRLRLARNEAGESIMGYSQAALAASVAPQGCFDNVLLKDGKLIIKGWALDPVTQEPARTLLVFVNGRYVGRGSCGRLRSDLADLRLRYAGFRLRIPLPRSLATGSLADLRLYVISTDGTAALMEYDLSPGGYKLFLRSLRRRGGKWLKKLRRLRAA